jgi:hypothetical protein
MLAAVSACAYTICTRISDGIVAMRNNDLIGVQQM